MDHTQGATLEPPIATLDEWDLRFLARIDHVLDEHLQDESLGVDRFAKLAAVSRRTLYRKIRELMGCSPAALLKEKRLERGFLLVEDGEVECLAELSEKLGVSREHLVRIYKSRHGISPGKHIRSVRLRSS